MKTMFTLEESATTSRHGREATATELLSLRRLAVQRADVAIAAAALAAPVAGFDARLAVALGVGSVAEGILTFVVLSRRRWPRCCICSRMVRRAPS